MSIIEENNDKNNIKDEAKELLKRVGKSILKKVVIIAMPFLIILIILAAITWFIFMDEGTWKDDERGNPSTYTNNVQLSTTEGITIDKLELVKKGLLAIGYTEERVNSMTEAEMIEALNMSVKLGRTITSINDCTVAEILWCINTDYSKYLKKPEDLEYLLNAELVTQYPKIDGIPADKLNGIIQFARVTNLDDINGDGVIDLNDGPKMLTYISPDEFDVKFQNYIDTGNTEVFNYFTLDSQENAVIATWTQEDGVFESNNTTLQDRDKITAGLTEESIQNSYNTNYTVTENTTDKITASYTKYNATKTTINYKSIVQKYTLPFNYLWALLVMGGSDEFVLNLAELAYSSEIVIGIYDSTTTTVTVNTKNYTENFRENYQEHSPRENPGKPTSGWTETAYTYFEKETKTYITNTAQIDIMYANTWIVELKAEYKRNQTQDTYSNTTTTPDENWSDNGTYSRTDVRTGTRKNSKGEDVEYTYTVIEVYYREKKLTGQSQLTQQDMYFDKYEKVKTDIREKTDIDPNTDQNFVKLLRADDNARAILFKPINVVWLCDILSANSNTANMVELTKYLINKAKNPDDTSLTFDFGIFEYTPLTGSLGVYGETIEDKVWYSLRNMGFSEYAVAGVMGNIYAESGFNPEIIEHGNGVGFGLCQWSYGRRNQLELYAAAKGVEASDVNTQIEFLMGELTPGGGANGYANYQLMVSTYTGTRYTPDDWKNATNVKDATTAFCFTFERPDVDYARLEIRVSKAEEYYEKYQGKTLDATANEIQLKIAEIAQNSSAYGIVARQGYCLAWVNDVYEAAGAKTERKDCAYCSGYYFGVSRDFSNVPIGAAVYGESYTTAGVKYGHVCIYLGNGMVADNIGRVRITTLDQWRQEYPDGCWGWTSSTPVNSAYPVTQGLIHAGRH